jgi:hypothetical protein
MLAAEKYFDYDFIVYLVHVYHHITPFKLTAHERSSLLYETTLLSWHLKLADFFMSGILVCNILVTLNILDVISFHY